MSCVLLALLVVAADPTPQTTELLKTFRDEFVSITPGEGRYPAEFVMGSAAGPAAEQPARTVRMTRPFAMARYEVPQNLYEAVMGENPSRWKGPRNSVELVSHAEAEAFCARATMLMRAAGLIAEEEVIRLPSEAEWEYCARAGTTTEYSFGDDPTQLDEYAWHTGNAAGNDPPVGAKKPNAWGLYDMHGYLWEWCQDHGHPNYEGAPADSSPWVTGGDAQQRVLRGGSWKDAAPALRSTARAASLRTSTGPLAIAGGAPARLRDDAVGLRCVLSTQPSP